MGVSGPATPAPRGKPGGSETALLGDRSGERGCVLGMLVLRWRGHCRWGLCQAGSDSSRACVCKHVHAYGYRHVCAWLCTSVLHTVLLSRVWCRPLTLATVSNIGMRTNLMNPIWAVALVTLSRSMKGATGRPSDFSRSLWGEQWTATLKKETSVEPGGL